MRRGYIIALFAGMIGGISVGLCCNFLLLPSQRVAVAAAFSLGTQLFVRLVQMVIAPLVLATLIGGIAKMDNAMAIGSLGVKTLAWFLVASTCSLLLGIFMFDVTNP